MASFDDERPSTLGDSGDSSLADKQEAQRIASAAVHPHSLKADLAGFIKQKDPCQRDRENPETYACLLKQILMLYEKRPLEHGVWALGVPRMVLHIKKRCMHEAKHCGRTRARRLHEQSPPRHRSIMCSYSPQPKHEICGDRRTCRRSGLGTMFEERGSLPHEHQDVSLT